MKNLSDTINEGRQIEYSVAFSGCTDEEGLPITVTILVDKDHQGTFESYLKDELDNSIAHACGYKGSNLEL